MGEFKIYKQMIWLYMKTSLVLFTLLLLNSLEAYAFEEPILSINKENVHFQTILRYNRSRFEDAEKFGMLFELSYKLMKDKKFIEPLYIYFNQDCTQEYPSYIAAGYDQFTYHWSRKGDKEIQEEGIKLVIRDKNYDIKALLNLINSVFSNISFIKENQKKIFFDQYVISNGIAQFDTLLSIPNTIIEQYMSSSDTMIERLIHEKMYRIYKKGKEYEEIDYYYQDNKFHVYKPVYPEESQEQNRHGIGKKYGEDILVVDNILEIFGSTNDGYFIFIDDHNFYYIPAHKDIASGPFQVENIQAGRFPIHTYYHEDKPIDRFILFFNYFDSSNNKKILFFPENNIIISNFSELENGFITRLFNQQKFKHSYVQAVKQPSEDSKLRLYMILIALVLSVLLNIWLWVKNQR